ncbi:CvpA family protein [Aerococcaceae bacterium DSM 111176]|nr:CvpA family protein [Aerococcaceae bacterium DSM 111176]
MFTLIIILVLAFGFYTGYRRGLAMQIIRILGMIISFILSSMFYQQLSEILEMIVPFPSIQPDSNLAVYSEELSFYISDAFYNVLAFITISVVVLLIVNFLSMLARPVMYYPVLKQFNGVLGGVLNLIATYVIIFVVLFILSLIPIEWIQQQFVNSPLAYWIVTQTPLLSTYVTEAWFTAG